jgi:hypothetical protein
LLWAKFLCLNLSQCDLISVCLSIPTSLFSKP